MTNEWPGTILARICDSRRILRKDMAAAIGVVPSVLSEYIAGKKKPSGDTRAVIEELYDIPSRWWSEAAPPAEAKDAAA